MKDEAYRSCKNNFISLCYEDVQMKGEYKWAILHAKSISKVYKGKSTFNKALV